MPRYVLLRHACPPEYRSGPHWDLMLEQDGVLRTWELTELPAGWAAALGLPGEERPSVAAQRLEDHRLFYLTHEGQVSGGRGSVHRVAQGTFKWLPGEPDRCDWMFEQGDLAGGATIDIAEARLTATLPSPT